MQSKESMTLSRGGYRPWESCDITKSNYL